MNFSLGKIEAGDVFSFFYCEHEGLSIRMSRYGNLSQTIGVCPAFGKDLVCI